MNTKSGLLLSLVFLVGCAVGGAASHFVAPPARAGTTPQKWAYFCITSGDNVERFTRKLDQAGAEGWELVAASVSDGGTSITNNAFWCFKRPLM
jgi:hypothetical protein